MVKTASEIFDLNYTCAELEVMSESRVTWATSVPILVFLGLSVLDLGSSHFKGERVGMPFPLFKKPPERMGTFPCVLVVSEKIN